MTPSPAGDRSRLAYQPAFDGLRCLGIVGALCAHASWVQPVLLYPATYMFVDMFFVISGYLITTLILREQSSTGRVSLKAFYVRRVARLYPVIVFAVVAMIVSRVAWPDATATASWRFIVASALYFANFAAIADHADALSAWVSLWSLSIEEQFYALWPIVLLLVMGRDRRLRRPLALVSILACAMWVWRSVSMYRAANATPTYPGEHFVILTDAWHHFNFSTFHRPDGLFIGCAMALILADPDNRWTRRLVELSRRARILIVGLILGIILATDGPAIWQVYWGLGVFNLLIALLLIDLLHHPESRMSRSLSLRPLVWVGRRSYFIYVIHLAVFTIAFDAFGFTSLPAIALIAGVIFVVAGVSYRWYENPIRKWGQRLSGRIISGHPTQPPISGPRTGSVDGPST